MIRVTAHIDIDEREIEEQFVRASGPGGQNVNKLSTAVQLRFDVRHSPSLPDDVRARLERLSGSRLTRDGVLVIIAQRHRTQARNRARRARPPRRSRPPRRNCAHQAAAHQADASLARAPHRGQEAPRRRQAAASGEAVIRLIRSRFVTKAWCRMTIVFLTGSDAAFFNSMLVGL